MLATATDAASVESILREYLEVLGPAVQGLPPRCCEALRGDFDVQAAAVTLLQAELRFDGPEDVRALLQDLAFTFAAASVRLRALFENRGAYETAPARRSPA